MRCRRGNGGLGRAMMVIALAACLVGLVFRGGIAVAQDAGVPTLHVYADLIQIPVLVLSKKQERVKPIARERFSVSLDSGPWFPASHVRLEGNDPISLAILLDVHGDESELMPMAAKVLSGLAPGYLHPNDRVSVYGLDCEMVRSEQNAPVGPLSLKLGVTSVLHSWTARQVSLSATDQHADKKRPADCESQIHLWDALTYMTRQLSDQPGRRVILAMSSGVDGGSKTSWNDLREFAQSTGVAIFGVTYVPQTVAGSLRWSPGAENAFNAMCELTGGVVLLAVPVDLDMQLKRFTEIVRERYIVEFPRPAHGLPGEHSLQVKIAKSHDMIRPAGISVPIQDAKVMADPSTVPIDPSTAPEFGTRKVLDIPK